MTGPDKPRRNRRAATDIVHSGRDPFAHHGFVNTPVYRGSTVLFKTVESFEKRDQRYVYGRRGTPTSEALEQAIAKLEGGARTWLAPSGAAAVATALLSFTKAGDHILVADTVYLPTRKLCDGPLKRFGVETTYYDPTVGAGIAGLMRPNTRLVYTESPGSLTFEVQDIAAIAAAAHAAGALVAMDNTWASPLYFKPFAHGADISIQAGTVHRGPRRAMLGAITVTDRLAPALVAEAGGLGICAGTEMFRPAAPHARGAAQRHWRSGLDIARWPSSGPRSCACHPALPSHPRALKTLAHPGCSSVALKPAQGRAGGDAGGAGAVRHGRLVGRVREPGAAVRCGQGEVGDLRGGGRADRALPHRARGRRRSEGRYRGRLRAACGCGVTTVASPTDGNLGNHPVYSTSAIA
jgi:cystathionine beta-lyase